MNEINNRDEIRYHLIKYLVMNFITLFIENYVVSLFLLEYITPFLDRYFRKRR